MTISKSLPYSSTIKFGPKLHPAPSDIEGLPTKEDIESYPVMFTWEELKKIIKIGDLALLKRPKQLQKIYDEWSLKMKADFGGSTESYLLNKRVFFVDKSSPKPDESFDRSTPESRFCIIANDWPYSTPRSVTHFLIWTPLPLVSKSQMTPEIEQDGVTGFTGVEGDEKGGIRGKEGDVRWEMGMFVNDRWNPDDCETIWFLNPPRLQSVKLLPHYHVFARRKSQPTVD
ncbi:Protein of unknown function DUF3605 [Phaffia rhodozyma]|uniref:Uncharacterized protein n=1 Tax=Phaffia rhodozyma TaxID=264483 RepID=A0A0F7SM52_PHARH|nr:Protein of unknown function DUF3605 [Phaffia rhodozyma]